MRGIFDGIFMGKIIAVTNQKGGVGKTTTSVNIAACLAKAGRSVLLIDMDPQANATSGIGVDKHKVEASIYNALIDGMKPEQLVVATPYKGLFLIPSHFQLTGAEIELTPMKEREYRLKYFLQDIRKEYDFLIIDCPPSLGLLTLNALTASDSVLIPIQAEYFALEGVSQLMRVLDLVRGGLNPDLEIEGALMTMCDTRTNLTRQVIEEVKKFFQEKVYKTCIPRNIKIAESPGFGKPIVYYDIRSIGAEKYLEVTGELLRAN
jgi:chromosome partitioning protein